ncbi:DUF222 domain-containing protein, partial [Oryzihumus sp.]
MSGLARAGDAPACRCAGSELPPATRRRVGSWGSHGVVVAGRADDGMVEYQLRLDPEGASVLEAAIGPLSAPHPVDGVSDLRSSDQRRGDALVEACRRSTAAGGEAPVQTKAQVFVTMDFDDLKDACGSGTVLGNGSVLGNGALL